MTRHLLAALLILGMASPALAQDRPKIGETIKTESGLVYKFTQLGNGPQPQTGDLMVIHGIGTLAPLDGARPSTELGTTLSSSKGPGAMSDSRMADGKEFWNTRTDGSPYEYTLGVDSVNPRPRDRHGSAGRTVLIKTEPTNWMNAPATQTGWLKRVAVSSTCSTSSRRPALTV